MNDNIIFGYYQKGFPLDYIINKVYRYKNYNNKPIVINGCTIIPQKHLQKNTVKY